MMAQRKSIRFLTKNSMYKLLSTFYNKTSKKSIFD